MNKRQKKSIDKMVSSRLKEMRITSGMSQLQVAMKIGYSESSISSFEHGSRLPSVEQLVILARLYNTTPNYLTGFDDKDTLDLSKALPAQAEYLRKQYDTFLSDNTDAYNHNVMRRKPPKRS